MTKLINNVKNKFYVESLSEYIGFKGMHRNEVISEMKMEFLPDSDDGLLIYLIHKTWYGRKTFLLVLFDDDSTADAVILRTFYWYKMNNTL
ncbi:hypothetical protein A0O34_00445 [Chryseobacterium glaciei]|uniref:Uncharacterized protein n=1 Tax=Chryseobacterium glaciei TaxID=1685010 RepID=A0A172XQJ4_9FLAO|nr:hypothetical protein [Chryseobacterium glaciei]ANF49115.1 hypothetical protein A0O34_00445 [Chryseobacterium glaciei]